MFRADKDGYTADVIGYGNDMQVQIIDEQSRVFGYIYKALGDKTNGVGVIYVTSKLQPTKKNYSSLASALKDIRKRIQRRSYP